MNTFSSKNRTALRQQLQNTAFDLLVIGGGITGAGIALDATARGLRVALIDMQDFAAGTSGRSTKLIHGGLRYLKQMEFKLVAEVGKEREIIHRLAPHLTHPEPMLLPITKTGSFGKLSTRLGMWLYEKLAGVKSEEKHKALDASAAHRAEPLLETKNLLGAVVFYEYRTDDARLTVEIMKEAVARGAVCVNYIKAVGFEYENKMVSGVSFVDVLSGDTGTVSATCVVNAAGPWVDDIDRMDDDKQAGKLNITKGVHLVVDHKKLPVRQSLYMDTYDKRMLFVIPRDGKTYIGTTDTFYKEEKTEPEITPEDKAYLLRCVNACFPANQVQEKDIESGWAGLRPLINKPGKGPSEISRKDELFVWPSGLITIAGGKLTGYRKMAQRVVDAIARRYKEQGRALPASSTAKILLANDRVKNNEAFARFVRDKMHAAEKAGVIAEEARLLINRYGINADRILETVTQLRKENYSGSLPLVLYAQLLYAIDFELCCTPADFFIRRTAMLYFDVEAVRQWKGVLTTQMANLFGWDEIQAQKHLKELDQLLAKCTY